MAAVTPVTGNNCRGRFIDGTDNIHLKCKRGVDDLDNPVYTCSTYRLFKVNCPKVNVLCNTTSEAFVAAITVCNQRLF